MKRIAVLAAVTALTWVWALSGATVGHYHGHGYALAGIYTQPHGVQIASLSIGSYRGGR